MGWGGGLWFEGMWVGLKGRQGSSRLQGGLRPPRQRAAQASTPSAPPPCAALPPAAAPEAA